MGKSFLISFFPENGFTLSNQEPGDTSKFQKWQKRVLGEPPTIYNEELSQSTSESMKFFLQYNGYYDADVYFVPLVKKKKIYITYHVNTQKKYTVDSIFFSSKDAGIDTILHKIRAETLLGEGAGLEGNLYEKEKKRISKYLRNNGYAYFYPYYFAPLEADTTLSEKKGPCLHGSSPSL